MKPALQAEHETPARVVRILFGPFFCPSAKADGNKTEIKSKLVLPIAVHFSERIK
jgi:hypothetical protein